MSTPLNHSGVEEAVQLKVNWLNWSYKRTEVFTRSLFSCTSEQYADEEEVVVEVIESAESEEEITDAAS